MPVIKKAKIKIPTEDKTKGKILTTALEIGCLDDVKKLMISYDKMYLRYRYDPISCAKLAENLLQELASVDIRLIAFLFNEDNEILVNNKVVMKLVDDGK